MEADEVKKMQKTQYNILIEFDKILKKHDIPYFLAYGTCLGAIRHNGFIPWDDDIDVMVLSKDLKKIKKFCQAELPPHLFYQDVDSDLGYSVSIPRIRNSQTTLIEKSNRHSSINKGVFMDIYPLYPAYKNKIMFIWQLFNSLKYRMSIYSDISHYKGAKLVIFNFAKFFCKEKKSKKYLNRYNLEIKNSIYYSSFHGDKHDLFFLYRKADFVEQVFVDFEGSKFPVPNGYDKILRDYYGDYMKLPSQDKQIIHHDFYKVDFENPYTIYDKIDRNEK